MPDALNYRVGPHPGCLFKCLMADLKNRTPARGVPSVYLTNNREGSPLRAWTGEATETDWPKRSSDRQLQEAQKKTLTGPLLWQQRQSMSLHTWYRQGSHKPSSCGTFMLNLHRGRATRGKKSLVCMHTGSLQLCLDSLQPCWLWPARLLCQGGGSPSKNTGAYLPVLVAITFKSTVFSAALATNPLSTWCCQNPCNPSSCTTSTPGPHRGKPKPSRAASGANPAEPPTHRGGKKITIETQGQCGWERRPKTFPPAIKAGRLNPHNQRGRLCVYGIYKRSLRAPTKENTLVLIAVDIGGKNTQE